jgi:hypothetical protein
MMTGLDGSGGSGPSCNLGGKDDSGYCGGGLFSEGKVSRIISFMSYCKNVDTSVIYHPNLGIFFDPQ